MTSQGARDIVVDGYELARELIDAYRRGSSTDALICQILCLSGRTAAEQFALTAALVEMLGSVLDGADRLSPGVGRRWLDDHVEKAIRGAKER